MLSEHEGLERVILVVDTANLLESETRASIERDVEGASVRMVTVEEYAAFFREELIPRYASIAVSPHADAKDAMVDEEGRLAFMQRQFDHYNLSVEEFDAFVGYPQPSEQIPQWYKRSLEPLIGPLSSRFSNQAYR